LFSRDTIEDYIVVEYRFNPSSLSALEVLECHVMALTWQDAQILGPVVGFIAVNVVHDFTRLEVTFEDAGRDQAMCGHGTTGNPNSRIWIVFTYLHIYKYTSLCNDEAI
jgi:hypothetical protein